MTGPGTVFDLRRDILMTVYSYPQPVLLPQLEQV